MKPETEHILQILRSAIRVLGYTNREIEQRLGVSGGYLTRLFSGVMELRFEHIVDIARAIGLEPQEIFELAYPQPRRPPTEVAQRLRETFAPSQPAAEPAAKVEASTAGEIPDDVIEQGMERMMMKVLRKLFAETMAKGAVGE